MQSAILFLFCAAVAVLADRAAADQPPQAKARPIPQKDGEVRGRGYVLPSKWERDKLHYESYKRHGYRVHHHVQAMTAPAQFDSRTLGWIPPIRNQANCGDCFGVSASDALTIAFIKGGFQKADSSFVISEQYGLDCKGYPGGCGGGDGPQVYAIMKAKGFPAEKYIDDGGKPASDYPSYSARPGACRLKAGAKLWKCDDWGYVTSDQSDRAPTVDEVKNGVMRYGSVTFAFDASALDSYSGKPITHLGRNIDHEITGFIGWDDAKACPDGSKGAFICRNQWGKDFGDAGYFLLAYTALPGVVEACFMTTAILPPPPPAPPNPPTPPPAPPGPAPGPSPTPKSAVTITLNPDGTYKITGGILVTREMTLGDILDAAKKLEPSSPVPCCQPPTQPPTQPEGKESPPAEKSQSKAYPYMPTADEWYNDFSVEQRIEWREQRREAETKKKFFQQARLP
jgi:hypothetical protein